MIDGKYIRHIDIYVKTNYIYYICIIYVFLFNSNYIMIIIFVLIIIIQLLSGWGSLANAQLKLFANRKVSFGTYTEPAQHQMVYIYEPRFQIGGWESRFIKMDFSPSDPRIWSTSNQVVFFNTETFQYNDIQAKTVIQSSEVRYKKNVKTISKAIDIVGQIRGTSFSWAQQSDLKSGSGNSFGFIAQEVEKILPDIVYTDSIGYKSMDYSAVIPIAIEAIKELSQVVENQQKEIERLKSKNSLKSSTAGNFSDKDKAVLLSNIPNPLSSEIKIGYYLPSDHKNAANIVFDMNGKQLKRKPTYEHGDGSVSISASELTSGMYLNSLIAHGKESDTKRMVVLYTLGKDETNPFNYNQPLYRLNHRCAMF